MAGYTRQPERDRFRRQIGDYGAMTWTSLYGGGARRLIGYDQRVPALGPISPPKASPSGHLPETRPRQQRRSRPATSTMSKEPFQRPIQITGEVRSSVSVWLVLPGNGLLAGNAAAGWAGEARQADDLPVDQRSELGEAVHQWMLTAGTERQDVA